MLSSESDGRIFEISMSGRWRDGVAAEVLRARSPSAGPAGSLVISNLLRSVQLYERGFQHNLLLRELQGRKVIGITTWEAVDDLRARGEQRLFDCGIEMYRNRLPALPTRQSLTAVAGVWAPRVGPSEK